MNPIVHRRTSEKEANGKTEKAPLLPMRLAPRAIELPSPVDGTKPPQPTHLPWCIAHRGYRAKHPENTMPAFEGAVAAGAHAIETDVRLTRDGVCVLSHDPDLRRCFGDDARIRDRDWADLAAARTTRPPHAPMPRLDALLRWLADPEGGRGAVWLYLDIKRPEDPREAAELVRRVRETLDSVPPLPGRLWEGRVVLGCWPGPYVRLCRELLPGYAVVVITVTFHSARRFLRVPGVGFSVNLWGLLAPGSGWYVRRTQAQGKPVYVWTVNGEEDMEGLIERGVDGVVTDDPRLFLDVCDRYRREGMEGARTLGRRKGEGKGLAGLLRYYLRVLMFLLLIPCFEVFLWWKAGRPTQWDSQLQV